MPCKLILSATLSCIYIMLRSTGIVWLSIIHCTTHAFRSRLLCAHCTPHSGSPQMMSCIALVIIAWQVACASTRTTSVKKTTSPNSEYKKAAAMQTQRNTYCACALQYYWRPQNYTRQYVIIQRGDKNMAGEPFHQMNIPTKSLGQHTLKLAYPIS